MSREEAIAETVALVTDLELAELLKESARHRREEHQLSAAVIQEEAAKRLQRRAGVKQ